MVGLVEKMFEMLKKYLVGLAIAVIVSFIIARFQMAVHSSSSGLRDPLVVDT